MSQVETHILGELAEDEKQRLADLRGQSDQIVFQIGLNRLNEQRLLAQLQQTERVAQSMLNQVGARLGIPDGTPWQIQDGQAILVTLPGQHPVPSEG